MTEKKIDQLKSVNYKLFVLFWTLLLSTAMLFKIIEVPSEFGHDDNFVFQLFLWLWIISIVVMFTASICIEIVLFQLIYLNVRLKFSLILFFYTIGHLCITAALLANFALDWKYYTALLLFVFLYNFFLIGIFAALVEVTKDYF